MEYQDTSWLARLATLLGGSGQPQGSPAWLSHIYTLLGNFLAGRTKTAYRTSTQVNLAGIATETVIYTIPLTEKVSAGDMLEYGFLCKYPNSGNNKLVKARLGGTGLNGTIVHQATLTTSLTYMCFKHIFFPTIATQVFPPASSHSDVSTSASDVGTGAVDMSGSVNLYITAEMAAAETINFFGAWARINKEDAV